MQANLQMLAVQKRPSIWDIWDFGEFQKVSSKKQSTTNKTKNNSIRKWTKDINRCVMGKVYTGVKQVHNEKRRKNALGK